MGKLAPPLIVAGIAIFFVMLMSIEGQMLLGWIALGIWAGVGVLLLLWNIFASILIILGIMPQSWMIKVHGTRRLTLRRVWFSA